MDFFSNIEYGIAKLSPASSRSVVISSLCG